MIALSVFVVFVAVLVIIGYINEKTLKLPTEISLLIVSFIIGAVYIIISYIIDNNSTPKGFPIDYLNDYLINGVLCFMLFSGSCGVTFEKLRKNIKPVSLLAFVTTTISTFIFGFILYLLTYLIGFTSFSIIECLLLGAIISPTDPIAATSILKKVGLSDDLIVTIEGESLLNDGVGIAIFIAISGALKSGSSSINMVSFLTVLGKEVLGAVLVALVISFILFKLFKTTTDKVRQIFISILAVSASYILCHYFDFSSAIASVVCGIYFATYVEKNNKDHSFSLYYDFWEVVDNLLNSLLYIILGIFFLNIFIYVNHHVLIIIAVVISVAISRYIGVFLVSIPMKKIPGNLTRTKFAGLLTWAGLKGGLSLALMIEASDLISSSNFHIMIVSVFAVVIFTTVIQGLSVEKFYKKIS